MPRYFFLFGNEVSVTPDLVGQELRDSETAKAMAAKFAAEVEYSSTVEGELPHYDWVEVVDEDERPIVRLPVSQSVREPNRSA